MNRPEWVQTARVRTTFDAAAMLAEGRHPLEPALAEAKNLLAGEAVLVVSPFQPVPLIEHFTGKGYRVACVESAPDRYETYIGLA